MTYLFFFLNKMYSQLYILYSLIYNIAKDVDCMKDVTHFYTDEVNDEFSGVSKRKIVVDDSFKFVHKNPLYIICEFIVHRIIVSPLAFFAKVFIYRQKTVGKKKLKGFKGKYIIYANHTQIPGDGLLPPTFLFPRKPYFVVSPDNIATRGFKNIMQMLGAIPTPTTLSALRIFEDSLKCRLSHGHPIVVYPEAHIWPYYTKIRNFKSTSFKYTIKFDVPAFCFVNTYQKTFLRKKPKIVTYIEGPFYPDKNLSGKACEKELRDRIYNKMVELSLNNTVEYKHHYIKKENNNE